MTDDLASLQAETEAALAAATDLRALDAVRVGVLGKSGSLTGLLKGLGAVPADQRKDRGAALNRLKGGIEAALEARRAVLDAAALDTRLAAERIDVTLPPRAAAPGTAADGGIHPIARTMEELTAALRKAIDDQMAGKTTLIEALINQELGEPFRRDAMKKPVVVAGISKADMRPQVVA